MRMSIAPQKLDGIEMVHVKFPYSGTKDLKITFVCTTEKNVHLPRCEKILENSREVKYVIIMADMNIKWTEEDKEKDKRYTIDGVEQSLSDYATVWITEPLIYEQPYRRNGVIPYSRFDKNSPGEDVSMPDQCITWIALKCSERTAEAKAAGATGAAGTAGAVGAAEPKEAQAQAQADFRIGHLNIEGAIRDKIDVLEQILVTGNYDIFGVTEIRLSEKIEGDIGITGYRVSVYPSPYGKISIRGTAIYIKTKLREMELNIAPQEQVGIEMVKVKFTAFINETLEIKFLYRPQGKNIPSLNDILKESSGVKYAIIMGDMNIDWLEEKERFYIHGVQQLVTEVTRPPGVTRQAFGTIIDHIWITRGILRLLNCDQKNRRLLNHYQDDIDELCVNQLNRWKQIYQLQYHQVDLQLRRINLNRMRHEEINCLLDPEQQLGKLLECEKDICQELKLKLNESELNDVNLLECEKRLKPPLNRGHGVDPYSNKIFYKKSKTKEAIMSDHCITWIALKRPEETEEHDGDSDEE